MMKNLNVISFYSGKFLYTSKDIIDIGVYRNCKIELLECGFIICEFNHWFTFSDDENEITTRLFYPHEISDVVVEISRSM